MLMVTANSCSRRPTIPPRNSTGMKTATRDRVMETMVKPISREPRNAASMRLSPISMWRTMFSSITMASSTTKPDRERERHQRQIVDRVAEQIHGRERSHDGERHREAGDGRGRDVPQEQEDDHHHEADRQEQGEFDVGDGLANGYRAVVENAQLHRGRDLRPELRQQLPDAIDDLDGIGPRLALNAENDGLGVHEPANGSCRSRRCR